MKITFSKIFHHNLRKTSHLTREVVWGKFIFWVYLLFIQFTLWLWNFMDPFWNESKGYPFTKNQVFLIILILLCLYRRDFEIEKIKVFGVKIRWFLKDKIWFWMSFLIDFLESWSSLLEKISPCFSSWNSNNWSKGTDFFQRSWNFSSFWNWSKSWIYLVILKS